jgi:hypothetical protein
MHMEAFLWMFLPVFVAAGSSLLSYYIMQARMEVALAKERESLAEARATITSQKITMEERIKATEEATKRVAMDEFMHDFRVDERSYARESKSLTMSKKTLVMQERLFFRNIPLSNWIEREMVVEEGTDLDQLPKESVFSTSTITTSSISPNIAPSIAPAFSDDRLAISKFLDEVATTPRKAEVAMKPRKMEEPVTLVRTPVAAFGAQ